MDKIWLDHYETGVPAFINADAYASLIDFFTQQCSKFADCKAFTNLGTSITYAELDQLSLRFAVYFQQELGLKQGDRVALMLPNILQYPIVLFAALRAGLIIVNVNPLYTAYELEHQLNDAGVETIVVLANFAHTVAEAMPKLKLKHIIITELGDMFPWFKKTVINFVVKFIKKKVPTFYIPTAISFSHSLRKAKSQQLKPLTITTNDVALLQYTGGTTGITKGVMLTHRNLIANVEQIYAVLGLSLQERKEIFISPLPLYHIFSLITLLFYFKLGGENVLITNPRDLSALIKEIKKFKFSVFVGVNTLFNALNHHRQFHKVNFSHLKFTVGGGMAVQASVAEKWQQITGNIILQGYGLTETSPVVTINPSHVNTFNGSIGLPVPSTEIAILDDAGSELPINAEGELGVRGPQVMKGYWNLPQVTQESFTKDGWLRTGDIVKIDAQGFVFLVDRKKDMIIVSGFNVYPNEVEGILVKHPAILEAGVIGVPDENTGEAIKALLVKKPDTHPTREQIIKFCRHYLTHYKIPKIIEFCDELPKTAVGKVLRRALRNN